MTLDLAAALPQLLPLAVAWAESQARLAQEEDDFLSAADKTLATKLESDALTSCGLGRWTTYQFRIIRFFGRLRSRSAYWDPVLSA